MPGSGLTSRPAGTPCRSWSSEKRGLIVEIVEQESIGYHGQFFFDLFEISLKRLAYALASELAPHGVTALSITPGFMRTEAILEQFGVTENNWREAAENNATAKRFGFIHSETPCFVGRAVAALAADPDVARWSGGVTSSWRLSEAYGFTDLDGTRPNIAPVIAEKFAERASITSRVCRLAARDRMMEEACLRPARPSP